MRVRLRAVVPILLVATAALAAPGATAKPQATKPEAAAAPRGLACLSAVVETLQRNGIDPFVSSPTAGAEPYALALIPADSEAAEQSAWALWLRRREPTATGQREVTIRPHQRPSQEEVAAAPPPPPPATPVAGGSGAYAKYIRDLTYIAKLRLDDPKNLRRAQQLLVSRDLTPLAHGLVALCSEIAAKSQLFASGVEQAANQNGGAEKLRTSIVQQPAMALNFPGWEDASLAIRKKMASDLALMASVSWRLTEISYGRPGAEGRLSQEAAKGNFTSGVPAPTSTITSGAVSGDAKRMMAQMLALGAHLHLTNQSSVGVDPAETALMTNKDNDQCLRWARLNLAQCLSAARDNAERAYCLGVTGIGERSKCWASLVGP